MARGFFRRRRSLKLLPFFLLLAFEIGFIHLHLCKAGPQIVKRTQAILSKNGQIAADSLYSCILNEFQQGIPVKQAQTDCQTKLLDDDKKGFGGQFGNVGPDATKYFDPAKIVAACNSGDPRSGQSSGISNWPGKGSYSWGGDSRQTNGYSQEESYQLKKEAVDAWKKAQEEAYKAEDAADAAKKELDAAKKSGDKDAIKKAQEKYEKAHDEAMVKAADALNASKKAEADPNQKGSGGNTRPVGGEMSACEEALQDARELLAECNRTKWKDTRCQQLQAKVHGCPDPTLILVDPDAGYTCAAQVDPEAAKKAWVLNCQQRVKYGPETNPCEPPKIDKNGHYAQGDPSDVCNDPHAFIDPSGTMCWGEINLQQYGQPNIQQILVIALNRLGGPIVVIPVTNPPPPPTGGPRPDPLPGR